MFMDQRDSLVFLVHDLALGWEGRLSVPSGAAEPCDRDGPFVAIPAFCLYGRLENAAFDAGPTSASHPLGGVDGFPHYFDVIPTFRRFWGLSLIFSIASAK
jgi:hypothetical protein